jgi:hypothetical protein
VLHRRHEARAVPTLHAESPDPLQRVGYALQHAEPIAGLHLPEQPRARVPRRIFALEQPPPVGNERQEDPGRLVQDAGEVRDRGVRRDDESINATSAAVSRKSVCAGPKWTMSTERALRSSPSATLVSAGSPTRPGREHVDR